jgi:hypothetical protein
MKAMLKAQSISLVILLLVVVCIAPVIAENKINLPQSNIVLIVPNEILNSAIKEIKSQGDMYTTQTVKFNETHSIVKVIYHPEKDPYYKALSIGCLEGGSAGVVTAGPGGLVIGCISGSFGELIRTYITKDKKEDL